MDVERAHGRRTLYEIRKNLSDLCVMLPLIALRVLFFLPEAQRHDSIRLHVRREDRLVEGTGLLAEDWQDLFVDPICDFVGLSRLGADFNCAAQDCHPNSGQDTTLLPSSGCVNAGEDCKGTRSAKAFRAMRADFMSGSLAESRCTRACPRFRNEVLVVENNVEK